MRTSTQRNLMLAAAVQFLATLSVAATGDVSEDCAANGMDAAVMLQTQAKTVRENQLTDMVQAQLAENLEFKGAEKLAAALPRLSDLVAQEPAKQERKLVEAAALLLTAAADEATLQGHHVQALRYTIQGQEVTAPSESIMSGQFNFTFGCIFGVFTTCLLIAGLVIWQQQLQMAKENTKTEFVVEGSHEANGSKEVVGSEAAAPLPSGETLPSYHRGPSCAPPCCNR